MLESLLGIMIIVISGLFISTTIRDLYEK